MYHDISSETPIYSYHSETENDFHDITDSYSAGTKLESLVFDLGNNAIDKSTVGKNAAVQRVDLVGKCLTKFEPHRVAICHNRQIKSGLYKRDLNNKEIDAYNQDINSISDQIISELQLSNLSVVNYGLEANYIRQDDVLPSIYGNQKIVRTLRNLKKWLQLLIK